MLVSVAFNIVLFVSVRCVLLDNARNVDSWLTNLMVLWYGIFFTFFSLLTDSFTTRVTRVVADINHHCKPHKSRDATTEE